MSRQGILDKAPESQQGFGMFDSVKDGKGVSAFPVLVLLALFLFLSFGPFSRTAAKLLEPVVEHGHRISYSVLSWIY
jgi:hypothetical protein